MTASNDDEDRAFRWVMAAFASIRVARGVSQQALADLAGIPTTEVERIESGSPDVHMSSIQRYTRVLGGRITFEIADNDSVS